MTEEKQLDILLEIRRERERQDAKWGEQNHPFIFFGEQPEEDVQDYVKNADWARKHCDFFFKNNQGSWEDILNEEYHEAFAEAAKGDMKSFREELIQVAAVVVAMIECVDRNEQISSQ